MCMWPEDRTFRKENTLKQKTQSFPYNIFVQFISTSYIYMYVFLLNENYASRDISILLISRSVIKNYNLTIMWTSEVETILPSIQCAIRCRHILNVEFHICSTSLIMFLVLVSLLIIVFLKSLINFSRNVVPSACKLTAEESYLFNEIFEKVVAAPFVSWKWYIVIF